MADKLILNADLNYKAADYTPEKCVVEKVIDVYNTEFKSLIEKPMKNNYYLSRFKELMGFYDEAYHCVLFVNKDSGDGLLVNSEGADYARYSQFIPNAKDIVQKHEQSLAIDDLKTHMDCCINNWLEQHKNDTDLHISLTEFINDSSLAEILADYASESLANHPQIACCQIIDGVIDAEKQELVETRLYCPLKIMIGDEDYCGDLIEAYSGNYIDYDYKVNEHIRKDLNLDEAAVERGLAAYFHDENLDKKVYSIMPKVETRNGELYGMAVVKSYGELDKAETADLVGYISGQFSDGWGEGFEQREIRLGDEDVYISFWNSDGDYFLKPESEVFPEQGLNQGMGGIN